MKRITYSTFIFLLGFTVLVAQGQAQTQITLLEQYQQTMKSLELLRSGIIDYQQDFKNAPQVKSFKELLTHDIGNGLSFSDFYLEQIDPAQIPAKDAWGNDFIYKFQNEKYWLASAGSDGKFAGFDQKGVYINTEKEIAGKDIIITNTGFLLFPINEELYKLSQRSLNFILMNE